MFSKDITGSDAFREMPTSSQALYFHLGMDADDDGFLDNYRGLMRGINASDDDLKILIGKRFLILFPSKVIVVKHWLINNTVRNDRYHETKHLDEKKALLVKENGSYTELGIPTGNQLATEKRIGKDRREERDTLASPKLSLPSEEDVEEVPDAPPKNKKVDFPPIVDWITIWNQYPNWKALKKTGIPPNPTVQKQLLPVAEKSTDIIRAVLTRRNKYSTDQFAKAVKNYAQDICNRTPSKNGYHTNRHTLYDFLIKKTVLESYVNR